MKSFCLGHDPDFGILPCTAAALVADRKPLQPIWLCLVHCWRHMYVRFAELWNHYAPVARLQSASLNCSFFAREKTFLVEAYFLQVHSCTGDRTVAVPGTGARPVLLLVPVCCHYCTVLLPGT